jgi:hypothetical protein
VENFIQSIIKNLETNGFPQKKVSLPTEKMYEVSDNKGFSFNTVLEKMKEEFKISSEIGDEKIVFAKMVEVDESNFPNLNPEMMKKAQEMMSGMDPEEFQKIQDSIENMSDKEKEEMMQKAKGMGLF